MKSYLGLHRFAVTYLKQLQFFQPIIDRMKHSCLKAICLLSRSFHVFASHSFLLTYGGIFLCAVWLLWLCTWTFVVYLTDPAEINSISDVVVVEGDPSITLDCNADGIPTPTINWTRVYANGSDSGVLETENQFVLETNRNNSGTYRCTAYNGIGTAQNRTVKVDVNCKYNYIVQCTYIWFLFFIEHRIYCHSRYKLWKIKTLKWKKALINHKKKITEGLHFYKWYDHVGTFI